MTHPYNCSSYLTIPVIIHSEYYMRTHKAVQYKNHHARSKHDNQPVEHQVHGVLEPPSWGSVVGPRQLGSRRPCFAGHLYHRVPTHVGVPVLPRQWRHRVEGFIQKVNHGVLVFEPIVASNLEPGAPRTQEQHPAIQPEDLLPGATWPVAIGNGAGGGQPEDPEKMCCTRSRRPWSP